MTLGLFLLAWLILVPSQLAQSETPVDVAPAITTAAVPTDADDPAIYIHPTDPARSLILGTNKVAAPEGALVVFGLDGKIRQTIAPLDRPNNVDVEYGLLLSGQPTDIAVLTERLQHRLRVFAIGHDGVLTDAGSATGLKVLEGRQGEAAEPMGISLYKRPRDGAVFAIVAPKTGPAQGYLWQYRLLDDGTGKVKAEKVREFGSFAGGTEGEIEAVAVDDALGYVYYADESDGIHKYHADPDHPQAAVELARFGTDGFQDDREGIAIYARDDGTGYILCTDQREGSSQYRIFRREGAPGNPHDHSEVVKVVNGGADSTDGLEVTSRAAGPNFPCGLMVAMNSGPRNFLVYRWEDIAKAGSVQLRCR